MDSHASRLAVRLDPALSVDPRLAATLNRFHFQQLLLLREDAAAAGVLGPGEGDELILAGPDGLKRSLGPNPLPALWDRLAAYLLPPGLIDNRTPPVPSRPDMDAASDALEAAILAAFGRSPGPPRPFGLVPSHDVDVVGPCLRANVKSGLVFLKNALLRLSAPRSTAFHALAGLRFLTGQVTYFGFDRILDIARRVEFTPVFFLYAALPDGNGQSLGERLYGVNPNYRLDAGRLPEALDKLRRAGAAIGLHGSYHSYDRPELLAREKACLEAAIGRPVTAVRQHYLHFAGQTTHHAYRKAGFAYESNCGHVTRNGYLCGTCRPFYASLDADAGRLVVVPMVFMDAVPLYFEPESPAETQLALGAVLDTLRTYGGMGALNFHQRMFSCFPEYADLYEEALTSARRLGGRIATLEDLEALYPEPDGGATA